MSPSHRLQAGAIAGIALGVFAAFLVIAAGIGYLFKRHWSTRNGKNITRFKNVAGLNLKKFSEMDGTNQVEELDGYAQGVPELGQKTAAAELEHKAAPAELQAFQYYHRD